MVLAVTSFLLKVGVATDRMGHTLIYTHSKVLVHGFSGQQRERFPLVPCSVDL
jgi:hypothetical protein